MITNLSSIPSKAWSIVVSGMLAYNTRVLQPHLKISTAAFFLGAAGYAAYWVWGHVAHHKEGGKVQSFALSCFYKLVTSNVLNPSTCHLQHLKDEGSIRESVGTNTAFVRSSKKKDYLVLRPLRMMGRFVALAAISTVAAPCGVGWHGGRLIHHLLVSRKTPQTHEIAKAFGQDLMMTVLIPSHLSKVSRVMPIWTTKRSAIVQGILDATINKISITVESICYGLVFAGIGLLYSSSRDLKNYIFALSCSLDGTDLQMLFKSIFLRQYFGLTGLNGNLLMTDLIKDKEAFTSSRDGHFSGLMHAVTWQLITKLEEIQNLLSQDHKLTNKHLTSAQPKNTIIAHLRNIPGLKKIENADTALIISENVQQLTQDDVEAVEQLWSSLDQLEVLRKDITEINLNKKNLIFHALGLPLRMRGPWESVCIQPFYKSEYQSAFFSIPSIGPAKHSSEEELHAAWQAFLVNKIQPELNTDEGFKNKDGNLIEEYQQFMAIKQQVFAAKTAFACLGLPEQAAEKDIHPKYRQYMKWVHPDKVGVFYPQAQAQAAAALTCALNMAKGLCHEELVRRSQQTT